MDSLISASFPVFFQYCNAQGIYPAQIQNSVTQNNRHVIYSVMP